MGLLFGRSGTAHPSDVFIRNVALVTLLALGVLLIWDQSQKPKTDGLSVSCWFPSHFGSSHRQFATHVCTESDQKYALGDMDKPVPKFENGTRKTIDLKRGDIRKRYFWASGFYKESIVVYLVAEAAIVVVAYLLLRNIAGRARTQAHVLHIGFSGTKTVQQAALRLKSSFSTAVSFILVQMVYLICMVIMLAKTRHLLPKSSELPTAAPSQIFLCDFKVIRLGNVQRYTAQCIGTPPEPEIPSGILQLVIYTDVVLCGVLALMIFLHLIQTTLLAPSSTDVTAAYGSEVISSTTDRLLFGCSDMNLAAMFLDNTAGPHTVVISQPGHGVAPDDPGYDSRSPMIQLQEK